MSTYSSSDKGMQPSHLNTNRLTPDMNFSNLLISDLKDHIGNVLDQLPREHHTLSVDNVANLQLSKADLIKLLTEALKQRDAYYEMLRRRSIASREPFQQTMEDDLYRLNLSESLHPSVTPPPSLMSMDNQPSPLLFAPTGQPGLPQGGDPTVPLRVTSRLDPPKSTTSSPHNRSSSLSSSMTDSHMGQNEPSANLQVQLTSRPDTPSLSGMTPTSVTSTAPIGNITPIPGSIVRSPGSHPSLQQTQPILPQAPVPNSISPPASLDQRSVHKRSSYLSLNQTDKGKTKLDPRSIPPPYLTRAFTQSAPISSQAPIDDPNYPDILRRYLAQAEIGDTYSQVIIGKAFMNGTGGVKVNAAAAMDWLQMAADQGVAEAEVLVGIILQDGMLIKKRSKKDKIPETDLRLAADMYKRASDQGDLEGMTRLGKCYMDGEGVKKDEVIAVSWYKVAANLGGAKAQNKLGWCYWKGKGVEKDWHEAVRWYKASAAQDYPEGQINYGLNFTNFSEKRQLYGWGGVKDETEAVKWLWRAAENGSAYACFELGACIEKGLGVQKNATTAALWYRRSAESGFGRGQEKYGACCMNGNGVEKDPVEGIKWLRLAAEQGESAAQKRLGLAYQKGEGVEIDLNQAVEWFRKASAQGCLVSQTSLASFYENGWASVPRDINKAISLYTAAAKAGNAQAQCNLGFIYERGIGVPQNLFEADRLYKSAVSKNHPKAEASLAVFFEHGIAGNPKDPVTAVKLYASAAKKGDSSGNYNLGRCYQYGIGTEQDMAHAAKYYKRAIDQNNMFAMANMADLLIQGAPGIIPDPAEGVRLLHTSADMGNAKSMHLLAGYYKTGVYGYGNETQPTILILPPNDDHSKYWFDRWVKTTESKRAMEAIIAESASKGVPVPEVAHAGSDYMQMRRAL
ncbi:hypothetical protein HDV05_000738 [Chytridiales sp. JEL 0842]|nr:hypothetical protein HDV05_000738 [Chytridiales sp. JEL 0842]